ncbi:PLP-dependent aminotransferase family protein [Streptomyces sp. NPDC050164]|uniref:PLP-dependent aminotransferase family protein n=1 Tax=Streptomyces sp. NPDC050164 TaxID=3365605 RepID=UPI003793452C
MDAPPTPELSLGRGPVELSEDSLHSCLTEPFVQSMNFLNEIVDRHPNAISFAPGAPYEGFFEQLDVGRYVERYAEHLRVDLGLDPERVRHVLYQYGPSRGQINSLLAQALSADEAINVAPEAIVMTVGCQEALFLTLRVLCSSHTDRIAVVAPAYVGLAGAASLLDVPVVSIGEGPDGIDIEQLRDECDRGARSGERVRAVYVAPDFANPSGVRLDLPTRRRLLTEAERRDFLVIEDTAYRFTAADALPSLKSLDRRGRVVQVGTFAKVCLPGARVGYVVADQTIRTRSGTTQRLADAIATAKSFVTVNTSPLSQAVIGGMLLEHNGSLHQMARAKGAWYRRSLGLLLDELEHHLAGPGSAWSWSVPEGGFFVRLTTPVPADEALLELSAQEFGVLWTPMRYFHLTGDGDHQIRLSCSYLTEPQIREGVARLTRFLRSLSGE